MELNTDLRAILSGHLEDGRQVENAQFCNCRDEGVPFHLHKYTEKYINVNHIRRPTSPLLGLDCYPAELIGADRTVMIRRTTQPVQGGPIAPLNPATTLDRFENA